MVTCTTPSKDWPHPQPGRVNRGAAKYRTTRKCVPSTNSHSCQGAFPTCDRCRSWGRLQTEIAAHPLSLRRQPSVTVGSLRLAYCGRDICGGGYVQYFATRRAVPPGVVWASTNAPLVQARGATCLPSWSSLRNIAHAARFGRNETLIAASS